MENFDFNNIRSFRDEEVNKTLRELIRDEGFLYILRKIFTDERIARLGTELDEVKSVYDFQSKYISYYVNILIRLSVKKFTYEGIEKLDKNKSYLFISNHRDIILDSALINEILFPIAYPFSIPINIECLPSFSLLYACFELIANERLLEFFRSEITSSNP